MGRLQHPNVHVCTKISSVGGRGAVATPSPPTHWSVDQNAESFSALLRQLFSLECTQKRFKASFKTFPLRWVPVYLFGNC